MGVSDNWNPRVKALLTPFRIDLIAAIVIFISMVATANSSIEERSTRPLDLLGLGLLALGASGVAIRRQANPLALIVAVPALWTYWALNYTNGVEWLPLVVILYHLGFHREHPMGGRAGPLVALASAAFAFAGYLTTGGEVPLVTVPATLASFLGPFYLGRFAASRADMAQDALERARLAEAHQDELAKRAVQEERARIAREMHDVVAHGMSVMVVQAGAARLVAHSDPDAAAAAMERIEEAGRAGLAEMRRVISVLRSNDESKSEPKLAPAPGLDDIAHLVIQFTEAGYPTTLRSTGEPPGYVGETFGLAAYRIVQEALTNVVKHAGPRAKATVTVDHGDNALRIRIIDNGRGAAVAFTGGSHGIAGMAERAELYGGRLTAHPRPGGGFQVEAVLPYQDTRV